MSTTTRASNMGGWLRGTTIRKGLSTSSNPHTRSASPQVQSTSTTIFGGGVKDPSGRVSEFYSKEDVCPVCKSDRFLNPKLRLLVSSCYHKMCESCIDRLFTLGPAPCPICTKTLRKLAFTPQTFEDLEVEKEVSIRRRINKEFNRRREDFPDLRAYNDYLEELEDIIFNLINNLEPTQTEARITALRALSSQSQTETNLALEAAYAQSLLAQEEAEKQERQARALAAQKEEDEEREERERDKARVIELLERSQVGEEEAWKLIEKSRREAAAKKKKAKQTASAQAQAQLNARLLRTRAAQSAVLPDPPHVPLCDDYYVYDDMFEMRERYEDPASDAVRRDRDGLMRAGGYRVEEAWERALRCAVAGLEIMPLQGLGSESENGTATHHNVDEGGDVVMAIG
ncbi:hypothetical protein JAAARDRAFT_31582 [Jaapia argillacea MUCL 33604]|uniref:RNA polymerase II transcription factor B subunit 3 n=1 Tax=Jaapia argillacea MUCL 33604 TaxID=933084 RepID=A0A067QDD9_9AGAM|nr:hypothetical protein JAAARDRAFT_31582 [Jaapia argillacea MUCL 33604]